MGRFGWELETHRLCVSAPPLPLQARSRHPGPHRQEPASITRTHPAAPKIAWVAPYPVVEASTQEETSHLSARIMSMGRLHHAFTGTGAAALAVAAAIPGTVAHKVATGGDVVGLGSMRMLTLHHHSGVMSVGAQVRETEQGGFVADRVAMSRSARRLMEGTALLPTATWPS